MSHLYVNTSLLPMSTPLLRRFQLCTGVYAASTVSTLGINKLTVKNWFFAVTLYSRSTSYSRCHLVVLCERVSRHHLACSSSKGRATLSLPSDCQIMAEGGCLPWKVQQIDTSRGPVAEYRSIHQQLPKLPNGSFWVHDETTGDWKVQKKNSESTTALKVDREVLSHKKPVAKNGDTLSSSTTETKEATLAIDYVEHTVLPSDTFQGLCLRYRITATQLRQANGFSGTNLLLAPPKLVIPLSDKDLSKIRLQDQSSPDFKIHSFLSQVPELRCHEARAYLELYDWDVEQAVTNAQQDVAWEKKSAGAKDRGVQVVHVGISLEKDGTKPVSDTKKMDELEMVSLPKPI